MPEITMKCGCRIFCNTERPEFSCMEYCKMHNAAPALVEALKSRRTYERKRLMGQFSWEVKYRRSKKFWLRYERLIKAKEWNALALVETSGVIK